MADAKGNKLARETILKSSMPFKHKINSGITSKDGYNQLDRVGVMHR